MLDHEERENPTMSDEPIKNGDVILPPTDAPYFMTCCDCGLVHALHFSINSNVGPVDPAEHRIELRVYRDEDKTVRARGGSLDWYCNPISEAARKKKPA